MRFGIFACGLVSALAVTIGACTVIDDKTATQCRSEDECRSRGPEFADTTCSVDRVCVKLAADDSLCSTNQQCTDKNGGAPYRCLPTSHKCAPLTSTDCPRVVGDKASLLNDETIFLGTSYIPNIDGQLAEDGAELAISEINVALGGGLPSVRPGGPKRPLALLTCPAEPTTTGLNSLPGSLRALDFVSNVAQVPGVIGPFFPGTSLAAIPQVLIPSNVTGFITGAASAAISDYQDNDLIFRMAAIDTDAAKLMAAFMTNYLEPRAYTDGIAAAGEPLRVQIINTGDGTNAFTTDYIIKNLTFNGGKSTADNGSNFRLTTIADPTDRVSNPDTQTNINKAIADAINFKAHIILFPTIPTTGTQLLVALDGQWPTPQKPLYVSTVGSWANQIVAAIGNRDSLRKRYFGLEAIAQGFNEQNFGDFVVGLRVKFPELLNQNVAFQAGYAYDAVYLSAYSIIAAGATQLSGPTLSNGIRKVTNTGPTIKTGTADLPRAVSVLQGGGAISVQGVTGPIQFNDKGDRPFNARLYCVAATNGVATSIQRPGYTIDATTGVVTGMVICP